MKQKSILLTAVVATVVLFFSSCKIEETTNPSNEVTLGSGTFTLALLADLDFTNDTNSIGNYMKTYEPMTNVVVTASTNQRNFYATQSGTYEDEVVTGTTDANGRVTLDLPVGQRANIQYQVRVSDKFVEQKTSNDLNIKPIERLAYYNGTLYISMNKGAGEIQKLYMPLQ
jgi:hypothetical protein